MHTKQLRLTYKVILGVALILVITVGLIPINSRKSIDQHQVVQDYSTFGKVSNVDIKLLPITIYGGLVRVGVWGRFYYDERFVYVNAYINPLYASMNSVNVENSIFRNTEEVNGTKYMINTGFMTSIDEPQNLFTTIKFNYRSKYYVFMIQDKATGNIYSNGDNLKEEDKTWLINFVHLLSNEK